MDADEVRRQEAGTLSPAAASLSTNATAFCIASLLGADELGSCDKSPTTTEQDVSDSGADSTDNASESKVTGEPPSNLKVALTTRRQFDDSL